MNKLNNNKKQDEERHEFDDIIEEQKVALRSALPKQNLVMQLENAQGKCYDLFGEEDCASESEEEEGEDDEECEV